MPHHVQEITLLDCTLRDGSYQVGFGFTAGQTSELVAALERAGIGWIEVGHGLGLGAAGSGRVSSAESDKAYITAARRAASRAKIGVFAMQAYASTDDIDRAVDLGIDFIRVGVDAGRFAAGENFVRHATARNVHVTTFLMKSYTLGIDRLAANAACFADWGSDAVAIVDSAGGMTPPMVRDYVSAVRDGARLPVVFHGHNNLQLAVGNSLAAIEAGATTIDASLHGLGRSAGNAQIEALAIALTRCGYATGVCGMSLARLADRFIAGIQSSFAGDAKAAEEVRGGVELVDLVQGASFVHSAQQPTIDRIAAACGVDRYALALAVGEVSGGLDLDQGTVRKIAEDMARGGFRS